MADLHVVPCKSTERLVGPDNRAGRLGDFLFRRESPDVGDLVRAGAAQFLTPAAVVEEHDPATIFEDGLMSRRHRHASVITIINIRQGQETNHTWHWDIIGDLPGHVEMAWEEVTHRTCREFGGFEPDIRHRTNDANVSLALVARGLAVTMLPDLVVPGSHPGVTLRAIAECWSAARSMPRRASRTPPAPSTQALLAAIRKAVAALPRN